MGTNLTSKGFQISQLSIQCVVDKSKLNTWFYTTFTIRLSYEAISLSMLCSWTVFY
jgi:hypothetical protein